MYVSDDYGVTWSGRGASRAHTSITSDGSGNRLAVTVNNEGVYLSSDRGITWTLANITDASSHIWFDVASDHSGQHLTAVGASNNLGFIVYSHDFGITWFAASNPCSYSQMPSNIAMSRNGQYLFANFDWCSARSADYGVTWTQMTAQLRTVAFSDDGQKLAAVNGWHAYTILNSTDYGVTWTPFNHPADGSVSYASVVMDATGLNIIATGMSLKSIIRLQMVVPRGPTSHPQEAILRTLYPTEWSVTQQRIISSSHRG